jgi:hypothetical protein
MIATENIIGQLVDVYLSDEEWWHKDKLSVEESYRYFSHVYKLGNIIVHLKDEKLVGYLEFFRLDFCKFGKYVCHEPVNPFKEDVRLGNVCVVHNVWIDKNYRGGSVFKDLKRQFYQNNRNCDYFVGHAIRKTASQPIKVFKKSDLQSKLFKGEI